MSYADGTKVPRHNSVSKRMTDAMPAAHGNGIQAKTSGKSVTEWKPQKKIRRAG